MLTGRVMAPEEALRLGAVSRVVPRDRLDSVVHEVVVSLLSRSPAILMLGRDAFPATAGMGADAAFDFLQVGLTAALTEDATEGVAAFLDKRPPHWVGR